MHKQPSVPQRFIFKAEQWNTQWVFKEICNSLKKNYNKGQREYCIHKVKCSTHKQKTFMSLSYVVFHICRIGTSISAEAADACFLSTSILPRMLKLEWKERAWKFIPHSQFDVKPLDGLPWNRWHYNMWTALLTDPSILCLCWESSTSLQRALLSQNCQMATPPFMWKGSWSLQ